MQLDLPSIRRDAQEGLPIMPEQVLVLVERVEESESELAETRAALNYYKGGQSVLDLAEACRQLRAADERVAGLLRAARPLIECAVIAPTDPIEVPLGLLLAVRRAVEREGVV